MRLDKSTHQYFSPSGEEYLSVSAMLALAWPFKADEVSAKEAARPESIYYGMTTADILADWDERRDGGTELHAAIESFVKTGDYPKAHPGYTGAYEFEGAVFRGEFPGKLASETIVWSDRWKLAGTCDLQQLIKTDCWLWDIKTSRVIGEHKWLKYSVQLHLYRVMIMEMLATAEPSILPCHFATTEDVHVGGVLWFADYARKPGRFTVLRPLPCWNELQWVLNMRKKMI